jgi:acyl-CoA thioesterase-1
MKLVTSLALLIVAISLAPAAEPPRPLTVLCLGDSLTAGYGVEPDEAYPALLEAQARAAGWPVRVINAGLSGETSAGGRRRLAWLLRQEVDVLIVALGANDGLRGVPVTETRANLTAIVTQARQARPGLRIVLAGMQMPPNLGAEYTAAFRALYPALATELHLPLIPFLLEGVGGVPAMNQDDGIHPNPAGHRAMADHVWQTLAPVLRELLAAR